ncbi:MAG: hypothetical protein WBN88_22785 [Anderseniella sp.]
MHSREGFFQAAAELVHDPETDAYSTSRTNELRVWFSENLDRPDRFSNSSSKGYYRRSTKGLSWFKASAKEHISKAFELKSVLEENGYAIEVLKESRLGYVVYEDDYQVVAEPFSDTTT